jgi:ABC-2 type transport system permease protein
MNTALTLVRRELWENRGNFYIMIGILFGIIVLASAVLGIAVGGAFTTLHPTGRASAAGVAILGLSIGNFIFLFYSLSMLGYLSGSLYDDRKDGSVLFWRSLPVSDTATVISKAAMAMFVGSLLVLIAMIVGHLISLLALATAASARGAAGFSVFASPGSLFGTWVFFAYALFVQALWWLPYYGWLLLVSAVSPRGHPLIWAIIVPAVAGVAELIITQSSHIFQFVGSHLANSPIFNGWPSLTLSSQLVPSSANLAQAATSANPLYSGAGLISQFLATPSMWIGIVIGLGLIALAVIARRYSASS